MLKYHGFSVIHKEAEEDFGLPRTLTLETLQDEQYLYVLHLPVVRFLIVSSIECSAWGCRLLLVSSVGLTD